MDKLSAHSRERWPVDTIPAEWSFPGQVPDADGHAPAVKP
jgi:hypothetical protein